MDTCRGFQPSECAKETTSYQHSLEQIEALLGQPQRRDGILRLQNSLWQGNTRSEVLLVGCECEVFPAFLACTVGSKSPTCTVLLKLLGSDASCTEQSADRQVSALACGRPCVVGALSWHAARGGLHIVGGDDRKSTSHLEGVGADEHEVQDDATGPDVRSLAAVRPFVELAEDDLTFACTSRT